MSGLGMPGVSHFAGGLFMAIATVLGCDEDGNQLLDLLVIVYVGIDITLLRCVTLVTAHVGPVMLALSPFLHNTGIVFLMAFHAFLGLFGQLGWSRFNGRQPCILHTEKNPSDYPEPSSSSHDCAPSSWLFFPRPEIDSTNARDNTVTTISLVRMWQFSR